MDQDGDGIFDPADQCVHVPAGPTADPYRPGCPDHDSDGDGILDGTDQCPQVTAGLLPDPSRRGCPLDDRDHDQVPDRTDACPDKPGAPSADPKKNGCPGLVTIQAGQIVLLKPVFFATNKDVILKKSFAVLDSVASVLTQLPQLKKLAIEGHTDDKGSADHNTELSERRARSVQKYLIYDGPPIALSFYVLGRAATKALLYSRSLPSRNFIWNVDHPGTLGVLR